MTSGAVVYLIVALSLCFGKNSGFVLNDIKWRNQEIRAQFVLNDMTIRNDDNTKDSPADSNRLNNKSICKSWDQSVTSPRRRFLQLLPIGLTIMNASSTNKASAEEVDMLSSTPKPIVRGTVNLPPGLQLPADTSSSALYVTARPNSPANVPKAILDGSNGKPPPVLATKIQNIDSFPCEFALTTADLTLEGNAKVKSSDETNADRFWWEGQDLIISSRWDTDGVAATRDPSDLVGRGFFQASKSEEVLIQLQGRGITGKLVTTKK